MAALAQALNVRFEGGVAGSRPRGVVCREVKRQDVYVFK
jgi:hypothetical protein